MTHAVLVYETGPGRGLGHRRRMEALAGALRHLGVTTDLRTVEETVPADVVVVDAYEVRADDGRFDATVLAAVDDLERDLAVDLLIDPNPGGDPRRRQAAGAVRCGLTYALVVPAPATLVARPVVEGVERILVTSGAADEAGWGPAVAAELHARSCGFDVGVVKGPWAKGAMPDGVRIVTSDDGLLPELAESDLVVTAGGVTLLEALLLGRPTVAVAIAANQARAVEGVAEAGAAVGLGLGSGATPEDVADAVEALAGDLARRCALAQAASTLIDGQGPARVAEALVALT